jgi:protein tyrosine phosphatase (PTP) superfamily phosphohydrolase (DUF442 family)
MNRRPGPWLRLLAAGVLTATGCNHCCRRRAAAPCAPAAAPGQTYIPPQPTPAAAPGFGTAPPANTQFAPAPPPGNTPFPPVPPTSSQVPPAPTQVSPEVRYGPSASIPQQADWRAAPPRPEVRLSLPEASTPEPPLASPQPSSPGSDGRAPTPSLPVGIPQFAMAKDQVATGLRPLLDGVDWLQANGYRTVLHVHLPNEDDSADRRLVERRGLKYLSLAVSPQTLTRAQADAFNRLVSDTTTYPLFVYDRDGMLAGGLWFLYSRFAEGATDEVARAKAAALGLKDDVGGEHRLMWLAIQRVLAEQTR